MSWLNSVVCFRKASNPEEYVGEGYTVGYCTGNLIILVTSLISLTASSALTWWHMRDSGWLKLSTYKKHKTWIFLLISIYMFSVVIRYVFNMYELKAYSYILSIAQLLQSIVMYLVCHFFAIKSTNKRSGSYTVTRKVLKIFVIVFVILFLGMGIYQMFAYAKAGGGLLCKTIAFVLPEIFNCLVSLMFIWFGF